MIYIARADKIPETASFFPSELGVHGTMWLPNRKEKLARHKCTPV